VSRALTVTARPHIWPPAGNFQPTRTSCGGRRSPGAAQKWTLGKINVDFVWSRCWPTCRRPARPPRPVIDERARPWSRRSPRGVRKLALERMTALHTAVPIATFRGTAPARRGATWRRWRRTGLLTSERSSSRVLPCPRAATRRALPRRAGGRRRAGAFADGPRIVPATKAAEHGRETLIQSFAQCSFERLPSPRGAVRRIPSHVVRWSSTSLRVPGRVVRRGRPVWNAEGQHGARGWARTD
jgi:hypothetical protein